MFGVSKMRIALSHSSLFFLLSSIVVFIFGLSIFLETADAGQVTLAWNPNTELNLAGYKLYYIGDSDPEIYKGTGAVEGDSSVTIYLVDLADSNSLTFTLTHLEDGQYYYFVLAALIQREWKGIFLKKWVQV